VLKRECWKYEAYELILAYSICMSVAYEMKNQLTVKAIPVLILKQNKKAVYCEN